MDAEPYLTLKERLRGSDCPGAAWIFRYNFGTLSERKGGLLTPKRHQLKHLEFVLRSFGTRGSEVQILSPRPFLFSNLQSSQGPKMRTPGNAPRDQFHFNAALLSAT
jgi:hypothetical protein